MKRHQIPSILGVALIASLLFAVSASAASVLGVEVVRYPSEIHRNDESISYQVKVKNTSSTDATSGTLNLAISLPSGLTWENTSAASGMSCTIATLTCTSSATVPPGGSYPVLKLGAIGIDGNAPDNLTTTAFAFGGGATAGAFDSDTVAIQAARPFGLMVNEAIASNELGEDETQAGAHPFGAAAVFRTSTRTARSVGDAGANKDLSRVVPIEDLRGGVAELPPGVVGNPQAANATCDFADLRDNSCPLASAVGALDVPFTSHIGEDISGTSGKADVSIPRNYLIYRLPHEKGYPASFGFKIEGPSFVVRARVRSDGDYGLSMTIPLVPANPMVYGANVTFCNYGVKLTSGRGQCKKSTDPGANDKAFITLGTNCAAGKPRTRFAVDSWLRPGARDSDGLPDLTDPNWSVLDYFSPENTGCAQLTEEWTEGHEPSFEMQPDGHAADSPAAYTAHLHIPQEGLEDPDGFGTSHLKDTTVTLPEGLSFNPAVGDRLEACSLSQIGYLGNDFEAPNPIRFDTQLPTCPEASKIGELTVDTPLLEETLHGSVFLAAQKENPFGSNYAIYLSVEEPGIGVVAKLAGKVSPDPVTGQIIATFTDNPQLPIEDIELAFFGGDRSALANPVTCGSHQVTTQFTPWSAADPYRPLPWEIAKPSGTVQITEGPHGSACVTDPAQRPFEIGFEAGSKDPIAGAKSPFSMRITRPDGSQELDRLEISPPPGFVASLRGIPYCSETQIDAARSNGGKAEQSSPSCPLASEIGTTNSAAGPGATPFYAPGKLYLAGPYKGQNLSVVAITPAVAGPYDLGNIVIRSALKIDPRTARITAVTDQIPQVFEGIPLRVRDVRINLDRPGWATNPTNCEAMSVDLTAFGSNGAVSKPSNRFQVGACESLGFKPKLSLRLVGGVKRNDNPALLAKLVTRGGDANIARAAVTLPHSAFLDQSHIRTICTRVQFAARACPRGAVYGYASATTSLLNDPIAGNVVLRSSNNKLPDLVADLRGVADIEAVGRIDSINEGIRTTFEVLPDAAVDVFELKMMGGKRGLVVNSRNLCAAGVGRATVKLTAQNGRQFNYRPKVIAEGCRKAGKRKATGKQR